MNPYLLFASIFLTTLVCYSLKFSDFNINLGFKVFIFLISAIMINFIFFVLTKKEWAKYVNQASKYREINVRLYLCVTIIFFVFGLAEVVYSGGMPLLGQSSYQTYGIPTVHVLLVCGDSFFILNIAKAIFLSKKRRFFLSMCFLIAMLPLMFGLSRGTIVIVLIGILMLYISTMKRQLRLKKIILIFVFAIVGAYLFGIAGNYRINHDYMREESISESSLILSIGRENQNFEDSRIPTPFFWTYIYLTSPISNFHLNTEIVNLKKTPNFVEYTIVNFFPDFISKRIYPTYQADYKPWKVTQEFTASSAFTVPYIMWGWPGLIIFILYELIFPIIYFELVKRYAARYFDVAIAIVSTMYILMPFANFFTFSALSLQLILPFLVALFSKKIVLTSSVVSRNERF